MTTTETLPTYRINDPSATAVADRLAWIRQCLADRARDFRGTLVEKGHGVNFLILDVLDDGRVKVQVTHLGGLNTSVRVGDILGIPADRITAFTSR
jgi:hypothetical protein